MAISTISIFNYFNYRYFLRDYFAFRKSLNRRFSHRLFAQKAGYSSSGLYLLLISGKQNMTSALLPKFIRAMELNAKESEYLVHLVEFTHAKTSAAKQIVFEKMMELLPTQTRNVGKEQRDYYRNWYHVAIREALSVLDIQEDYNTLAEYLQPAIKPSEAKASLKLLASLGLIHLNKKGFWRATHTSLASMPELGSVTIHPFQKVMIDLAKDALDGLPRTERHISCSTFSLSLQGYERLSQKLETFLKEIEALVRSDEKENRVYQFNAQLFPLSRAKE